MSFQKRPRIEDRALLDSIISKPCTVMGCREGPTDPHHITTVKAGGDDVANNVMPLCRRHHTEYHQIGVGKMCKKYPSIMAWLVMARRSDVIDRIGRLGPG